MRRAGLPLSAIAQQKQRRAGFGGPQAEAAARGEVERGGRSPDIGHDAGHGGRGQGFLGRPEEVVHCGRPDDDERLRVEPGAWQGWPIGQAEKLRVSGQLQVKDRRPPWRQQVPALAEGEGKACPAMMEDVGKHLLHRTGAGYRQGVVVPARARFLWRLHQDGFAFDTGDDVTQRGEALLWILGLHGVRLSEQNRNI